uniref:Uncharacterized protein n=1 Tax=Brassica oleracea TaxID=3712 RepID=A0A3P6E5I6_BRAOL|nr:unnamed protein product [Brassica oleracea]
MRSNRTRLVVTRRRLAPIVVRAKLLFGVVVPPVQSRFVTRVGSETGRNDEEQKTRSRRKQTPAAAAEAM